MVVPPGCPHAFANPGPAPVRMLFLVAPPGHEYYLEEMASLLTGGPQDEAAIAALRERYDITQLTPMRPAHASPGPARPKQSDLTPVDGRWPASAFEASF